MLAALLLASGAASAFVVFDKKVSDDAGKVNEPLHEIYRIINLGDSPATALRIDDAGIPLEQWAFPRSAGNLRWAALAPGENITHIFRITPLIPGHLRQGPARLRYVADGEKRIALSSQVLWFESRAVRSIGAKSNLRSYSAVVGFALGAVLLPYLVWRLKRAAPSVVKAAAKPKSN
jgi:hypothetical protein